MTNTTNTENPYIYSHPDDCGGFEYCSHCGNDDGCDCETCAGCGEMAPMTHITDNGELVCSECPNHWEPMLPKPQPIEG